jgi:hypothetical protein
MDWRLDGAKEVLVSDICTIDIDDLHAREGRGNLGKDGSERGGDVRDMSFGKDDIKSEEVGHVCGREGRDGCRLERDMSARRYLMSGY